MIIQYKGFSIEEDYRNPYSKTPDFMYYPTHEGVNHDYDLIGEDYEYRGNCKWVDSLEEAKDAIDDQVEKDFTDEHNCIDYWALNVANNQWRADEILKLK